MRDIATMKPGEHVTVAYKTDTLKGIFVGVEDGNLVVDYTFGAALIPIADGRVADAHDRVLVATDPEPDLRGDPPELE